MTGRSATSRVRARGNSAWSRRSSAELEFPRLLRDEDPPMQGKLENVVDRLRPVATGVSTNPGEASSAISRPWKGHLDDRTGFIGGMPDAFGLASSLSTTLEGDVSMAAEGSKAIRGSSQGGHQPDAADGAAAHPQAEYLCSAALIGFFEIRQVRCLISFR